MKTWDAFFRDVMPSVPQCPEPTAEHALLRAAQDFCAGSGVWTVWLDDVTTLDSTTEYDLPLKSRSELVKLVRGTLDGRNIDLATAESLPANWKTSTAGIRDCIFTPDRKTLVLLPAKAAGLILRLEVSLKPSDLAEGVENFIYDQYCRTIAMGAKASLMQQAGQPYANAAQGMALESSFTSAIASVAFQRSRGFSSAMPRGRAKTF